MIGKLYWRWISWRFSAERLMEKCTRGMISATVLQIGSNDGLSGDPLHKLVSQNPHWRAVFVEPIAGIFSRLRKNYGENPRFTFINAAVSETCGMLTLYFIDIPELNRRKIMHPDWIDQLATTDRSSLERCDAGRYKECIQSIDVDCIDGPELLRRAGSRNIDILHIDAEGHDWVILQTVLGAGVTPSIILVEHACLDVEIKSRMEQLLRAHYRVRNLGRDFLCVAKSKAHF